MSNKKMKFDDYEEEIIKLSENGELDKHLLPQGEKDKYVAMAKQAAIKSERINIRMTKRDLLELRIKADEYGMPYQTLITSVLHRYVSGGLVGRSD